MRRLLLLATALLLVPAASAHPSANRPVTIVAAETANEVLAVSLGAPPQTTRLFSFYEGSRIRGDDPHSQPITA